LRASRTMSVSSEWIRSLGPDTPISAAYLCPGWPPESFTNGIVTYVNAICAGLRGLGHEPWILAQRVSEPERSAHIGSVVDMTRIPARGGPATRLRERFLERFGLQAARSRRTGRKLCQRLGDLEPRMKFDFLEMEESFGWPRWVAGRVPVPVVVRLHGPWFLIGPKTGADPESEVFRQRVKAEGLGLRRADAITAPSRDVLERTIAFYGLERKPTEVIPNPMIIDASEKPWRLEDAEPDRILFVGRFDRLKGADTVIDAFARVLQERPHARLTIVGPDRGLNHDGHRWCLPDYVEHRLPGALDDGRVEWLGQQPPTKIHALRRRASATIVASRYENFPYVVLESLSIGCPTVASSVGGIPEIVEDGQSGLLFRAGDPADLARVLTGLLRNPDRAARLGAKAEEHARSRFSPEAVARDAVAFYERVLQDWRARRHDSGHKVT